MCANPGAVAPAAELLELGVVTTLRDLLAGGGADGTSSSASHSTALGVGTPESSTSLPGSLNATPASAILSRPSEQVNELLTITAELMPELPRDGIYAVQVRPGFGHLLVGVSRTETLTARFEPGRHS